jgi:serine/threonine-protein kinase
MDRDRWPRVDALVLSALALPPFERDRFLTRECGGDEALRREVESLLASEGSPVSPSQDRIAHYRIHQKLGEGGMGVVYLAEDERLRRRVALKVLREDSADPVARTRLVREAQIAAGISHPLICQVFELGEWDGHPFIVMELVQGEPLTSRLADGPRPVNEALEIAIAIVDALGALHRHGVIHRDLKPSNIFVTAPGIKLVDFGVARALDATLSSGLNLTASGMFIGTPQYAAPEQLTGGVVDGRTDLFAAGLILFELMVGRPPFTGATLPALAHAILHDVPPVLTGSPGIAAIDRILHKALAKLPADRYGSAEAMAADLRAVVPLVGDDRAVEARPLSRLAVLPFRLLTPDAEIDYLGVSLADALISSLLGLESLVVRSSLKSSRYANTLPDLNALAAELAVDMVLTGSIVRIHDRVRVSTELVSVPAGDVIWTQVAQVPLDGVFDLHDELSRRVAASLPLTARDRDRTPVGRTHDAKAFDLYLRGMQLRMETSSWRQARAFFDQALQLDPRFASAWAERGRLDRVLGKYGNPAQFADAEAALRRALELDADSGAAQYYLAQLEIDLGRVESALDRLLARARQGRAEPHIYAALVHACRYAGLLDASVSAHVLARRLDPTVATSVLHTYYMRGEFERALDEAYQSSDPLEARLLAAMGRGEEALAAARREEVRFGGYSMLSAFSTAMRAALAGQRREALDTLAPFEEARFTDGEGLFYVAEVYAQVGALDRALATAERATAAGFLCVTAFEQSKLLAALRAIDGWREFIAGVRDRQAAVARTFTSAGGPSLLGLRMAAGTA